MMNLLTIMGPTASGKSALAIELAKRLRGEVISADAFQVYRRLDVGTAKVLPAEQERIPHHLIDIKDATETYTVAEFCSLAKACIEDILQRGNIPILTGGTGLYVQALLEGYEFPDLGPLQELYRKYESIYEKAGLDGLIQEMEQRDPDYFAEREVVDKQRLIRALAVLEAGGSYRSGKRSHEPLYCGPVYALVPERAELYERINGRVCKMMADGLADEAKWLWDLEPEAKQARKAIGYQEWEAYRQGECTEEEVVELIQRNTRRFAKRQLTWLKRMPYVEYIDPAQYSSVEDLAEHLVPCIKRIWEGKESGKQGESTGSIFK